MSLRHLFDFEGLNLPDGRFVEAVDRHLKPRFQVGVVDAVEAAFQRQDSRPFRLVGELDKQLDQLFFRHLLLQKGVFQNRGDAADRLPFKGDDNGAERAADYDKNRRDVPEQLQTF